MLITFSGIDGSGKSTLAKFLTVKLKSLGYKATYLHPEYVCNNIMKYFCKEHFGNKNAYIPNLDPNIYIYGLFLDWIDLLNTKLNKRKKEYFICDRYIYDVIAQGIHYKANIKPIVALIKYFPKPDHAFYLKIKPHTAYKRLVNRKKPLIHSLESIDNLYKLESGYKLSKTFLHYPLVEINANKNLKLIKVQIVNKLNNII